mmetsp:Transcript_43068/g.105056  ORF Transcript_43068/g.105056 Transcript_43068/m.105056 type:complete len:243 (-) Transcript_43068:32-760(-)
MWGRIDRKRQTCRGHHEIQQCQQSPRIVVCRHRPSTRQLPPSHPCSFRLAPRRFRIFRTLDRSWLWCDGDGQSIESRVGKEQSCASPVQQRLQRRAHQQALPRHGPAPERHVPGRHRGDALVGVSTAWAACHCICQPEPSPLHQCQEVSQTNLTHAGPVPPPHSPGNVSRRGPHPQTAIGTGQVPVVHGCQRGPPSTACCRLRGRKRSGRIKVGGCEQRIHNVAIGRTKGGGRNDFVTRPRR